MGGRTTGVDVRHILNQQEVAGQMLDMNVFVAEEHLAVRNLRYHAAKFAKQHALIAQQIQKKLHRDEVQYYL